LKRVWMQFWLSGSVALLAWLADSVLASSHLGQASVTPHRTNESTLAGLRPGRDTVDRAKSRYKDPQIGKPVDTWFSWIDPCRGQLLSVEKDPKGKIQTVRTETFPNIGDCEKVPLSNWRTGRGLAIHDSNERVIQLYGQPDSKSPSTKGGQSLELLHYAFGWAGPDVPQMLEVLCTLEKDGKPGRVVEITLSAATF
jgi:hypothetical protein